MNESKLSHAIFGSVLSWALFGVVRAFEVAGKFVGDHGSGIALCFAIGASLATMWAGRKAGIYWRNKERDRRAEKRGLTPDHYAKPPPDDT